MARTCALCSSCQSLMGTCELRAPSCKSKSRARNTSFGGTSKSRSPIGRKASSGYTVKARAMPFSNTKGMRSEEHTSELQSRPHLVCRLLLEKKKKKKRKHDQHRPQGIQARQAAE